MTLTKNYSIVILDHTKIDDINKIIVKYSDSSVQSSSHVLFDIEPINVSDITEEDLTFFKISGENETEVNEKIKELIGSLNELDTDYAIRNDETHGSFTNIKSIGALDIKFDTVKIIKKGTYKRIDELKNTRTEYGYCKGYKPAFRPLEGNSIEHLKVKTEKIYLFSNSEENMNRLKKMLSEKITDIDSDLLLECRVYPVNDDENDLI